MVFKVLNFLINISWIDVRFKMAKYTFLKNLACVRHLSLLFNIFRKPVKIYDLPYPKEKKWAHSPNLKQFGGIYFGGSIEFLVLAKMKKCFSGKIEISTWEN